MGVLLLDQSMGSPSDLDMADTVETLARYAAFCQIVRLVPIVEAAIVSNGSFGIYYCAKMIEKVLPAQYAALYLHNVYLAGIVLQHSMVRWASVDRGQGRR